MNRSRRLALGLLLFLSVLGLLGLALAYVFWSDSVSTASIAQRAQQEKESVQAQLAEGKILYIKSEQYRRPDPSIPDGPWVGPELTVIEAWMGADADGYISTYLITSRSLDGDLVQHTAYEGEQTVSTWVATGDELVVERGKTSLAAWVDGVWDLPARQLAKGWSHVGQGKLNGKRSTIFEDRYTQKRVNRIEIMEETPLIWWSSQWELNAAGERTLMEEHRVLEYALVPAAPDIGQLQ